MELITQADQLPDLTNTKKYTSYRGQVPVILFTWDEYQDYWKNRYSEGKWSGWNGSRKAASCYFHTNSDCDEIPILFMEDPHTVHSEAHAAGTYHRRDFEKGGAHFSEVLGICEYCAAGREPYLVRGQDNSNRWWHEGGVLCQTPKRNCICKAMSEHGGVKYPGAWDCPFHGQVRKDTEHLGVYATQEMCGELRQISPQSINLTLNQEGSSS